MDLMLNADQEAIQETVRSFLQNELPLERVRRLADEGPDALAPLWSQAGELGFFGLGVPEGDGGSGFGLAEEMILFEELGAALAPGPWLGTVLAAHALAGDAQADTRAKVLTGAMRVAVIERPEGEPLAVTDDRVRGRRSRVPSAVGADALLILEGDRVLWVPTDAAAVRVSAAPSTDPTRRIATVELDGAPCQTLAADPAGLRREATVLSCAEAVGGIQRTVDMSVEYCSVRHQFGKPIGSFQAVKHRCADMAARAEMARATTIYATLSVRDGAGDADFQVSVAKLLAGKAYVENAADNVQNHGGMGFTWECDAHLYVKRARSFENALGSRAAHLDAIAGTFAA